jgi:hypothetical protein
MSRKDDIRRLIIKHNRRLQELKEQKALHGISVDPKVSLEIEDIESEIARLQTELETASDVDEVLPPQSASAPSDSEQAPGNNFSGGVQIGNVSGGISGSYIAGGNISITTVGEQRSSDGEKPTVDELRLLLTEIQSALAEVSTQKETLQTVSVTAPFTAMGAEQGVRDAIEKLKDDLKSEEAKSIQKSLDEATTLLNNILDGAATTAQKADAAGNAAKPLVEKLTSLVEKMGIATTWIAKIWMLEG